MKNRASRLNDVYDYLRSKGLVHSKKELANYINFGYTNLIAALKGNEKYLTDNLFCSISKKHNEISLHWLLTGEGNMIANENINNTINTPDEFHQNITGDPEREERLLSAEISSTNPTGRRGALVYDIDATCGMMSRPIDFVNEKIIGVVDLPEIKETSPIIRANGDSMEPVIFDGDRIVIREIFNWSNIFYGQIYMIVLDEYRMIKYIRKCEDDEENYVILRSKNKEYDDIKLPRKDIRKLFVVENILSVKTQL